MKLSEKEQQRYSRHLLLEQVGEAGQLLLKKAKVLVIGAGGLGCPVLQYLAAAGIGKLGIVDFDTISYSNLQRQILFAAQDVGKHKASTAKEKLSANNPLIEIVAYNWQLTNKNALSLFAQYDIVVDGTDNFSTRYLVNDACILANKPLVYGAIHKFEGQVSVFNYEEGPTYRCLFPNPPTQGSVPSCSEVGVLGILPGIIGMQQANEVLKIVLRLGNILSGVLLTINALDASFDRFKLQKKIKLSDVGITDAVDFEMYDYTFACETESVSSEITKEDFDKLGEQTFVLDVRDPWEVPKVERKKVVNIPLDDIEEHLEEIPKTEPVYVICQTGGRSSAVIVLLNKEFGYKNLINIKGGILG